MSDPKARGHHAHFRGSVTEDIAEAHYASLGYRTHARRYRSAAGEIDLVLEKDGAWVFVEVKARRSIEQAAACVSLRQWTRIIESAGLFLAENGLGQNVDMRFDLFATDQQGQFQVIQNATQDLF